MNSELGNDSEVVMVNFEIIFRHFYRHIDESKDIPLRCPVSISRFEPNTSIIGSRSANL
jgi:hypothetical protein